MNKKDVTKDRNLSVRTTYEFRQAIKIEAAKRGITLAELVLKAVAKEINYKGNY